MEIIQIPQVSLVDGSTQSIGVYSDDPKWWQNIQNEQIKKSLLKEAKIKNVKNQNTSKDESSETGSTNPLMKNYENYNAIRGLTELNLLTTMPPKQDVKSGNKDDDLEIQKKKCTVIGETPLHIAIIYNDFIAIKELVETKGFDVNQRSLDSNFLPGFNSKQTSNMISQSKYSGLAYFGEYPLALAACFASKEVYDYLIEKGADPNMQGFI